MKDTINLEPLSQNTLREKKSNQEVNNFWKVKAVIVETIKNIRHFINYLKVREASLEYNLEELAKNIIPRKLTNLKVSDLRFDGIDNALYDDYKPEIESILKNNQGDQLLVKDLVQKLGFFIYETALVEGLTKNPTNNDYVIIQNLAPEIFNEKTENQSKFEASFSVLRALDIKNIKPLGDSLICYDNSENLNTITSSNDKNLFLLTKFK